MTLDVLTEIAEALTEARERTLDMVAPFSDEQMETAHSALMSPLAWDLAHIAAYEDLWLVHRPGGEPLPPPGGLGPRPPRGGGPPPPPGPRRVVRRVRAPPRRPRRPADPQPGR